MTMCITVWDQRGEELEAHCDLVDAEAGKWQVTAISHKGMRGRFDVVAEPGATTLEAAIQAELVRLGIHASNNP